MDEKLLIWLGLIVAEVSDMAGLSVFRVEEDAQ